MEALKDLGIIISIALFSGTGSYFLARWYGGRRLKQAEDKIRTKMVSNGKNLGTFSDMIQSSPADSGTFERVSE